MLFISRFVRGDELATGLYCILSHRYGNGFGLVCMICVVLSVQDLVSFGLFSGVRLIHIEYPRKLSFIIVAGPRPRNPEHCSELGERSETSVKRL